MSEPITLDTIRTAADHLGNMAAASAAVAAKLDEELKAAFAPIYARYRPMLDATAEEQAAAHRTLADLLPYGLDRTVIGPSIEGPRGVLTHRAAVRDSAILGWGNAFPGTLGGQGHDRVDGTHVVLCGRRGQVASFHLVGKFAPIGANHLPVDALHPPDSLLLGPG